MEIQLFCTANMLLQQHRLPKRSIHFISSFTTPLLHWWFELLASNVKIFGSAACYVPLNRYIPRDVTFFLNLFRSHQPKQTLKQEQLKANLIIIANWKTCKNKKINFLNIKVTPKKVLKYKSVVRIAILC